MYEYNFKKNDFIICKPEEEKRNDSNKNFEVYARVVDIDYDNDKIYLDRYLKQGRLKITHCAVNGVVEMPLSQLFEFPFPSKPLYQPMNKREMQDFRNGLAELVEYSHGLESWLKAAQDTFAVLESALKAEKKKAVEYTD